MVCSRHRADALTILALAVALCGCPNDAPESTAAAESTAASASASAVTSPTPRSTEASRIATAKQIVTWLSSGEYEKPRELFDRAMDSALPDAKAVEKMWQGVVDAYGKLEKQLATTYEKQGKHHIVLVTCKFAKASMDMRVVLDRKDRLAGLQVTPSTHPSAFGERPQLPKPPFPYVEEEVLYDNPADKSKLGGTLTLPKGAGPFPVVLLITGSGPQDRDSTLFGHKPFLVIADHLTRKGIAVLRVDDRGVGKTTGEAKNATVEIHATDVEAGIAFLKAHAKIDPKRIGLIGHSEGGVIAPLVAAKSPDVAFLVSLAGPGVSGAELNPMQVEALLKAQNRPAKAIAEVVEGQKELMRLLMADAPDSELRKQVKALAKSSVKLDPKADPDDKEAQKAMGREFVRLLSPWFRSWAKLNPADHLARVKVPILIMIGDMDMQVPADVNIERAKEALAKAGNQNVRTEKLAGLNHLFQKAETGSMEEYATITETFNPAALELMTKWLLETAAVK